MFDIDSELEAIRKKRAFVEYVSKPHDFTAKPALLLIAQDNRAGRVETEEEEEKKDSSGDGAAPTVDHSKRRPSKIVLTESCSVESLSGPAMQRSISLQSDSKGSSGSRTSKQYPVSQLGRHMRNNFIENSTRSIQNHQQAFFSAALNDRRDASASATQKFKKDARVSQSLATSSIN